MPPKRKSEISSDASAKKQKATINEANLTASELSDLTHAELVQTVLVLQKALAAAAAEASLPVASTWTPEKIATKARSLRDLARTEIKKQMKWQPSCKTSGKMWSYTGLVPNQEVFDYMLRIEKGTKPWKMKKIPRAEFEGIFGYIRASCRYRDLEIISENVNVKWNAEELTFQLSGKYGIPGII